MTLLSSTRRAALLGVVVAALPLGATLPAQGAVDVLITGAMVYDGTGAPGRVTNVGIRGDRIAFVGAIPTGTTAARRIDATGLIVSPGFIDPHTHS